MSIFQTIGQAMKRWWSRMIPYSSITQAERIQTPLSSEMVGALSLWYDLYRDRAPWKEAGRVKSLNLAALAASEIARQVVLEVAWDVAEPEGERPLPAPRLPGRLPAKGKGFWRGGRGRCGGDIIRFARRRATFPKGKGFTGFLPEDRVWEADGCAAAEAGGRLRGRGHDREALSKP